MKLTAPGRACDVSPPAWHRCVKPETWVWLKPRNGRYEVQEIAIGVRRAEATVDPHGKLVLCTSDIRPLLDRPRREEDKLDQLLRWLGEHDLDPRTCKHAEDAGEGSAAVRRHPLDATFGSP